ncbi:MAG: diacylglycerol/lipid kinase family protein [Daejeonella sp.]
MKKKLIFLINPISGGKNKQRFPDMASEYLDRNSFQSEYVFTEGPGHAFDIAREIVKGDTDILVAVGGDGTINEVASAILGSGKTMGIVPYGSGNGLARSLGIPLNDKKAISRLSKLNSICIDTGELNAKNFFNMAGMGFDAHISTLFADGAKRGLHGYVKTTLSEISGYKPLHYRLEIDGRTYERNAFMISIANSPQFGNNAHISPLASLKDGLLDVCITKPFPLYHFPVLGYRMFNKSTHRSKYIEIIRGTEIRIVREINGAVHLDGEPAMMGNELNIKIKPLGLSILV